MKINCKICNKSVSSLKGLAHHIRRSHSPMTVREYYDEFMKKKGEGLCSICGGDAAFKGWTYMKTCGLRECVLSNRDKSRRSTLLKRYGVDNPFKSESIMEDSREKTYEKYGGHPLSNEDVRKKIATTNLKRYGQKNPFASVVVKKKIAATNLKRHGHENAAHGRTATIKREKTRRINYWPRLLNLLLDRGMVVESTIDLYVCKGILHIRCENCGRSFESTCNKEQNISCGCMKTGTSNAERQLFNFMNELTNDSVRNYRKYFDDNSRRYYELDIYVPSKKIGVELDGLWWHSELAGKDRRYHLNKTEWFNNRGIRVIQVFENEWATRRPIVESVLANSISLNSTKIYARKCRVVELSNRQYVEFLTANHLQGGIPSKYRFALEYNGEVVMVIGLGKSRFERGVELHRMCPIIGTTVVGGFSKLMKAQPFNEVTTYCDRRYFDASGYRRIGFVEVSKTGPNYWYFRNKSLILESRMGYQKHKLSDKLDKFDDSLTEWDNMIANGWNRIWDCGSIKLKWYRK